MQVQVQENVVFNLAKTMCRFQKEREREGEWRKREREGDSEPVAKVFN